MSFYKKSTAIIKNNWRTVSRFTGAEVANILLTAVAGFLMVRHISKTTYGVYAFLTTGVTLIISLSEVGINHCFLPLIGYLDVSLERVNAVFKVFKLRRIHLLSISCLLIIPFLLYFMYKNNWITVTYLLAVTGMLIAGYYTVNEQLYRQKFTALHQSNTVSNATFTNGLIKAIWTILALFCFAEPITIVLLACNGLAASVVSIWIYKRAENAHFPASQPSTIDLSELRQELKKIYDPLKLAAFIYILYASFGNIVIGYLGNVITLADVNATGRLTMSLIIIDRIAGAFIMPKLAQARTFNKYKNMVVGVHLIYCFFAILIVCSAWLFPTPWLFLIGEKYNNLKDIIWIAFLGAILTNLAGFSFTCLTSRGYTSKQMPILLAGVISQVIAITCLGMHTTIRVFIINLITAFVFAAGNVLLLYFQLRKYRYLEVNVE